MKYTVEYTSSALKSLKKLNKHTLKLVMSWISKNLVGCEDPRLHGKALSANQAGKWRYRIGYCRLLCDIQDDKIVILILSVGHRRDIYSS